MPAWPRCRASSKAALDQNPDECIFATRQQIVFASRAPSLHPPGTEMKPIILHGHERALTRVKFNLEGDLLFSAAKDKSPCVWFTHSGERLGTYKGHNGAVWNLDVDYTSTHLLTASADFSVRLWDVKTGLYQNARNRQANRLTFSPLKAHRSPPSTPSLQCALLAGHTAGSNVFTAPIARWASNLSFAFCTRNSFLRKVRLLPLTAVCPHKYICSFDRRRRCPVHCDYRARRVKGVVGDLGSS